jgi:dTDP-glucose 4,6-dehydratase
MKKMIVTGGAGFIGSNFVRHVLGHNPGWTVYNADRLTYAGNIENLADLREDPRHRFFKGDIADAAFVDGLFAETGGVDAVVNFAAETHVDRSIENPAAFVRTNVAGTAALLEAVRRRGCGRFLQISTDEVYGTLGATGSFTEDSPLNPTSPYSATKAGADLLVLAYRRTFAVDALITRSCNNYGPYQFPEKLVPLMIINARKGLELPIYGTGANVRTWIHVEDNCRGIMLALERGGAGEIYNLAGLDEISNLEIVNRIADRVAGDRSLVKFVKDRPAHDFRYSIRITKAERELGFEPSRNFQDGLDETISWYLSNEKWWRPLQGGEHARFQKTWYGDR